MRATEIRKLLPRAELLRAGALQQDGFRGFVGAIDRGADALSLIAEVKKASPSAGAIVESFDPVAIAQTYKDAEAHAVSVLTDEESFQGSSSYMTRVRAAISLPVLRKDFILHEAQIFETFCAGADAILIIAAALEQEHLWKLNGGARTFPPDVLVEVHSWRNSTVRSTTARTMNWNQVCVGGLTLGALAIADENSDVPRQFLTRHPRQSRPVRALADRGRQSGDAPAGRKNAGGQNSFARRFAC